jgi:hypothetical protein
MVISHSDGSARARISRKVKVVGTLVAFGAVTLGGFSLAAPASAKYINSVTFKAGTPDEAQKWNKGWDACRKKYPQTQSIKFASWGDDDYMARWSCFDDPKGTW